MALGADRRNVLGLVLRSALLQLGIGLAIDIPVALVGGRILAGELYGVKNYDAMILGLAATILVASALNSSISSGTSSSQRGSVGRLALRVIHTVMTRVLFTTPKRF